MTIAVAYRKTLRRTMRLPHAARAVFPLLCPVLEYEWIEWWRCEMLFSNSGVAEEDCVFRTDFPGEEGRVWQVSRYEPPLRIEFVTFVPQSHTLRLNLALESEGQGVLLHWTHVLTALTPAGRGHIDAYVEAHYKPDLDMLEASLRHCLATGTMLRAEG